MMAEGVLGLRWAWTEWRIFFALEATTRTSHFLGGMVPELSGALSLRASLLRPVWLPHEGSSTLQEEPGEGVCLTSLPAPWHASLSHQVGCFVI